MGSVGNPIPGPAIFYSNAFPLADPLICSDDTVSRGSTLTTPLNLLRGTVVQYNQATKLVAYPPAAGTANAILAQDCNASTANTPCVIYVGGIFRYTGMTFNTANDAIGVQIESLRSHGIQVESVLDVTGTRQPVAGTMTTEVIAPSVEVAKHKLAEAKAKLADAEAREKAADTAEHKAEEDIKAAKKEVAEAEDELKKAEAEAKKEADAKKAEEAKKAQAEPNDTKKPAGPNPTGQHHNTK